MPSTRSWLGLCSAGVLIPWLALTGLFSWGYLSRKTPQSLSTRAAAATRVLMSFGLWPQRAVEPEPEGGLTLHISLTPSELPRLRRLAAWYTWWLRQELTVLYVVIDTPHRDWSWSDRPRRHHGRRLRSQNHAARQGSILQQTGAFAGNRAGNCSSLVEAARHELLSFNVSLQVSCIRARDRHEMMQQYFAFDGEVPATGDMFKNSVAYAHAVFSFKTRYMVHMDSDILMIAPGGTTPWTRAAVHTLEANDRVSAVEMPKCLIREAPLSARLFMVRRDRLEGFFPVQNGTLGSDELLHGALLAGGHRVEQTPAHGGCYY